MRHALLLLLALPVLASAQTMQATHVYSGLDATSARIRLERGGTRPYAVPFEAAAMRLPPAMEIFTGLRLPGETEDHRRPSPLIQAVRSSHRAADTELGLREAHDVLFFSEKKVVVIRVHLRVAGESFATRWKKQLRDLFDFQDRDGDGELNAAEADYVFTNKGVQAMINRGFSYPTPTEAGRTLPDFDLDRNGRVSFDEFLTYYRPSANDLLSSQPQASYDVYGPKLTEQMFGLLDTNKDGKLAKEELVRVQSLFGTQDLDEDECLTPTELVPDLIRGGMPAPKGRADGDSMQVHPAGQLPDNTAETIVGRYRKDQALKFSKTDHPFTDAAFAALDKNKDGNVSLTELLSFTKLPPDVEIELAYGNTGLPSVTMRPLPTGSPWKDAFRTPNNTLGLLRVGTQTIQFHVDGIRNYSSEIVPINMNQLGPFPNPGKGYITEADIPGPQNQYLRVLFDTIDRNTDGRLTIAEYEGFRSLQQSFTKLPLSLVHKAQTPSLFQIMDENGDRRINTREVRNAWTRLIAMEPKEKDAVTRDALKPDGAIRFGQSADVQNAQTGSEYYVAGGIRRSPAGPGWFQKLDKNGDGELSRREFPGSQEEFTRWDKNTDGGITPDEAEAERVARKLPK